MKKCYITILIGIFAGFLILSSCGNPFASGQNTAEPSRKPADHGTISARVFLPDYHKLAARRDRAIAPQTAKVRLSIGSGSGTITWTPHGDDLAIDWNTLEPVEGAPYDLPGGIWTAHFPALECGEYAQGKLKVELLDVYDQVITLGYNEEAVVIYPDGTTGALFFTTPAYSPELTGNLYSGGLAFGEMTFWRFHRMAYSSYTLTLTAEDSWPDIVFFNDDGTFHSYHSISGTENNENEIELPQEASAMYYYIGIWADAGDVTFYNLVFTSNFDGDLIEDAFAGGDLNGWMGTASGNGATSPGTVYDQDIEKWVVEFDSKPAMYLPENERLWVSLSRTVDSPVPMGLSFSIKTDIGTNVDTAMVLYIDDLRTDSWNGLGGSWARKTFIIDAGSHELKWVLEKDKGNYYESATNKVWIGNVSLIPDVTDSVVLYPRADQETYAGGHTIQYTAKALRSDGSVRSNAGGFVFTGSGSGGSVDSNGLFTPSAGGTYTVSVSQDGKTASAGTITVHPGDYLRRPYTYPGTGQTYTGYSGSEGSLTTDGGVTISYPAETSFSADGFFTLEGSVNNPDVYNYVYVQVTKGGLETYYLLRDTFKTRIWLRFGAGSYTVRVWGYSQISLSPDLGAEGDFISGSYYQNPIIFTVTNTRDEAGVDEADRRFLYPSFIVQSDDFRVTNLAADLTYGITDLREKARAVHDHLVTNTVYDGDSYPGTNRRKKQDALTVLRTRYHIDGQYEPAGHYLAVCEGYANASAALLRAAGIETKYLLSSPMNHAWNNVYIDGWKFYDATWDDPVPNSGVIADYGPGYVRHKYFLLDSMTGVDNDHYGDEAVPGRYIGFRPTPPRQKGVPDGWY